MRKMGLKETVEDIKNMREGMHKVFEEHGVASIVEWLVKIDNRLDDIDERLDVIEEKIK